MEADIDGKIFGTLQWVLLAFSKSLYNVIKTQVINANNGNETVKSPNFLIGILIIYLFSDALCRGRYIYLNYRDLVN